MRVVQSTREGLAKVSSILANHPLARDARATLAGPHGTLPAARDVLLRVDQLCEPYGGTGAYAREDQVSHRRVADEIHQLNGMAYVSPMIFLRTFRVRVNSPSSASSSL